MARSAKVDLKQGTFDFEAAAAPAAAPPPLTDLGKGVRDADGKIGTVDRSSESIESRDNLFSHAHAEHNALGVENTRPLGLQSAGRAKKIRRGSEYYPLFNESLRPANPGRNGTRQAEQYRPVEQRFNDTGNTGNGGNSNQPDLGLIFPEKLVKLAEASPNIVLGYVGPTPPKPFEPVPPEEPKKPVDYHITVNDRLGSGTKKQKYRDNIEAIKMLKGLQENEAPFAFPDQQKVLLRYVGWGGIPQAFNDDDANWHKEYEELKALLSADEYSLARRSTQDAHYTSQDVINGIYAGLERLGVRGQARILEPGAGIGNFIGLKPESWQDCNFTAIELDPITAAIGRYLYPSTDYINRGYQHVNIPQGHFDLAIGNPPFGSQKIYDLGRTDLNYSIHNYFLAKSIDALRDGGISAFVVSRYFMDAVNNPARDYIAERANFLGAIRLPYTAFKENALTEVTTDIVFFQKTEEPNQIHDWLGTGELYFPNTVKDKEIEESTIALNKYFLDNPGQMIGTMEMTQKMYEGSADLIPPADMRSLSDEIKARLACLPENIYSTKLTIGDLITPKNEKDLEKCVSVKVGSFFITGSGEIARRLPDTLNKPDFIIYESQNKSADQRIRSLIPIRDCLNSLMDEELKEEASEPEMNRRRAELNRLYDQHVKKFGYIYSRGNHAAMKADPQYPLLRSLERDYDPGITKEAAAKEGKEPKPPFANKAPIFSKRVLHAKREITSVGTPKEALLVCMNKFGKVLLQLKARSIGP